MPDAVDCFGVDIEVIIKDVAGEWVLFSMGAGERAFEVGVEIGLFSESYRL